MKTILTALGLGLFFCGAAGAFDLQGTDAAGLRAAWNGPAIPLSAPMRVEEKGLASCGGSPLTMRLKGRSVTLPAAGVWTLESHLATREDSFPGRRGFPAALRENIGAHLANSCALIKRHYPALDCGEVYDSRWTKEWTPPENGRAGQGSVGNLKPSKAEEMWIFNMMWSGAMPKAGTKFLATYNGRSVVVVGGYERGPSSKKFLGGFQREVLWYLGAEEGRSRITLSALADQSLPPGPVRCGH